jgi:hypothetical protein
MVTFETYTIWKHFIKIEEVREEEIKVKLNVKINVKINVIFFTYISREFYFFHNSIIINYEIM